MWRLLLEMWHKCATTGKLGMEAMYDKNGFPPPKHAPLRVVPMWYQHLREGARLNACEAYTYGGEISQRGAQTLYANTSVVEVREKSRAPTSKRGGGARGHV